MRPLLPPEVLSKRKHGFEAPISRWLRHELRESVEDILFSSRAQQRGIFDHRTVKQLWADHLAGVTDGGHRLWILLMLELWFLRFMDPPGDGIAS